MHIAVRWETPATCSHTRQDSSLVYGTSWLLLIQFSNEANYIVLRPSHFFSVSSSSPITHQQIMDTQPPQPGERRSKSSRLAGTRSDTSLIGTEQERRHQLVHRDAADAATRNIILDAHFTIVSRTGTSKNTKQHAVGDTYMHSMVNGHRLYVQWTEGVSRELRDQYITGCNGKLPYSTKAIVRKGCEIEHHDVVSSGIFADEFPDKHPRGWTKQP